MNDIPQENRCEACFGKGSITEMKQKLMGIGGLRVNRHRAGASSPTAVPPLRRAPPASRL